jgi:molybdate-binding protein
LSRTDHGFAVSKLREILAREKNPEVDLRLVGGRNSLVSLDQDACDLAGMHLPQGALRDWSLTAIRSSLSSGTHRVVSFVAREMGR